MWRIRITKFPSLFELVTAIRRKFGVDLRSAVDLKDQAVDGTMMHGEIALELGILIEGLGGACELERA